MMLNILYVYLFNSFVGFAALQIDEIDKAIVNGVKNKESKTISGYFAPRLIFSIANENQFLRKYQAELTLEEFFKNNKIELAKKISSSNDIASGQYLIYEIRTNGRNQKMLIKLISDKNQRFISEFKID